MYTLERELFFSGRGVHTGQETRLRLKPSTTGSILLQPHLSPIKPVLLTACKFEAHGGTVLKTNNFVLRTVEHLLASLICLRIGSLEILWEGEEVPILDGSAAPFVEELEKARRPLKQKMPLLKIIKPLEIKDGQAWVRAEPAETWEISYEIEFNHPMIARQALTLEINEETFKQAIAPARTFGFLRDVENLRRMGLAHGSSWENTVVLGEREIINPPLRFPDEFVRHKILDFIGDLALLGCYLQGRFSAFRAGHQLHQQLVRLIRDNKNCWILKDNFV